MGAAGEADARALAPAMKIAAIVTRFMVVSSVCVRLDHRSFSKIRTHASITLKQSRIVWLFHQQNELWARIEGVAGSIKV
jgi:hypothetical protein